MSQSIKTVFTKILPQKERSNENGEVLAEVGH